jgi:hypothetical protein
MLDSLGHVCVFQTTAFFAKMAAEVMGSPDAGQFLRSNLSLSAEADVDGLELSEEAAEEYDSSGTNNI